MAAIIPRSWFDELTMSGLRWRRVGDPDKQNVGATFRSPEIRWRPEGLPYIVGPSRKNPSAVDHNNSGRYHIARTHFDEPVTDFRMPAN